MPQLNVRGRRSVPSWTTLEEIVTVLPSGAVKLRQHFWERRSSTHVQVNDPRRPELHGAGEARLRGGHGRRRAGALGAALLLLPAGALPGAALPHVALGLPGGRGQPAPAGALQLPRRGAARRSLAAHREDRDGRDAV